jgi:hypothetical protein
MIFRDGQVQALDLTSPADVQKLIEVNLCGRTAAAKLSASDEELLRDFVNKAMERGVAFEQFNELLLVLNQDRVSRPFFDFFFISDKKHKQLTFEQLRKGVIRFKGFAMVCFGNFRFAFRRLSAITDAGELHKALGPCCRCCADINAAYDARPNKVLDTTLIERAHTWFVGEITGNIVAGALKKFEEYRRGHPGIEDDDQAIAFADRLVKLDQQFENVQNVALRNTDVYLTWDYLDVYVATSMRNKWEYEEIFDFTSMLFQNPGLAPLKLRYFDPTQSKCKTSRDKGLLEGLMLKRASCTIYMAQETDTLGKDSELATTLAQGKPVIAYVPTIEPDDFVRNVAERPLQYAKLRLLHLQASGILEKVDGLSELAQTFLIDLSKHRKKQPFDLWDERDDSEFKQAKEYWDRLCHGLAEAEAKAFDSRANVLKKYHPLGMQMDLRTGVANGVLVVRTIKDCADLLVAILRNKAEFSITAEDGSRTLVEKISESVFRVVTDNEKLTNSFWNLYEPRV